MDALVAFVFFPFVLMIRAWVFLQGWNWFITPMTSTPPPKLPIVMGCLILLDVIRLPKITDSEDGFTGRQIADVIEKEL